MKYLIFATIGFVIGQVTPAVFLPLSTRFKKKFKKRFKPFDCSPCSSFWATLFISLTDCNLFTAVVTAYWVYEITKKFEEKKFYDNLY